MSAATAGCRSAAGGSVRGASLYSLFKLVHMRNKKTSYTTPENCPPRPATARRLLSTPSSVAVAKWSKVICSEAGWQQTHGPPALKWLGMLHIHTAPAQTLVAPCTAGQPKLPQCSATGPPHGTAAALISCGWCHRVLPSLLPST